MLVRIQRNWITHTHLLVRTQNDTSGLEKGLPVSLKTRKQNQNQCTLNLCPINCSPVYFPTEIKTFVHINPIYNCL